MNLGTLLPGESREVQIPVSVGTTTVPFSHLIAARFEGSYDTHSGEQAIAAEIIAIEQSKPLDIQISAKPKPIAPLGQFNYTLTYGNAGIGARLDRAAADRDDDAGGASVSGDVHCAGSGNGASSDTLR